MSRSHRIPALIALLRGQALPVEAILPRLNRTLAGQGLPEVPLRTLQHDLEWLRRQLGTEVVGKLPRSRVQPPPPPELRHHRWFYRLAAAEDLIPVEDPSFISELEALALRVARAVLAAEPGPGQAEGPLAGALGRLLLRLGLGPDDPRIPDLVGVNRSAPQAWDPAHALALLHAIRLGDGVVMRYRPVDKAEHEVQAQPVRLAITDGEPYLWAWDAAARRLKTYKLARIGSLTTRPRVAGAPAGLDREVRSALTHAFRGVSSQGQRARVTVRFSRSALPFVRERRLGGAQEWTELPDGGVRVAFNTHGLDAVRHWLLQFGPEAVVEAPDRLVAWMGHAAEEMARAYARR